MKPAILALASLIALVCAAETAPPAPAAPAKVTVTTRTTRVVIVRAPVRYYGYNLLGHLIGASIVGAVEAHHARAEARAAAYVPPVQQSYNPPALSNVPPAAPDPYEHQYADAPVLTEMIIESNPPGARVVINGQPVGVTPLTGQQNAGSVYLLIRLDGYDDFIREFNTPALDRSVLSRRTAGVHVTAELKPHQAQ